MWYSRDALEWKPVAVIEDVRLDAVLAGGPGFVAVGHEDTDIPGVRTPAGILPRTVPAVWTSADGRTWTAATSIDTAPFPYGEMDDVAITGSGFVAVGEAQDADGRNRPAAWTSSDGLIWTVRPGDPLGTVDEPLKMQVAAGDGGVIAVGLTLPLHSDVPGPVLAWWAPDGATWHRASESDSFTDGFLPAEVVAFGSGFVMVGQDRASLSAPDIWFSVDGRTWSDPTTLPVRPETGSSFVDGLATDGSILVAVGDDVIFDDGQAVSGASIWMSTDAVQWTQVPPEELSGDALLDATVAWSVARLDDTWIVLGTTWTPTAEQDAAGIVWFERDSELPGTT